MVRKLAEKRNVAAPIRQYPGRETKSHATRSLETKITRELHLHRVHQGRLEAFDALLQATWRRHRRIAQEAMRPTPISISAIDIGIATAIDIARTDHPDAR